MGTQTRPELSRLKGSPGPGHYLYKTLVGDGPKPSLKARHKATLTTFQSPGPAAYAPDPKAITHTRLGPGIGYGPRQQWQSKFTLSVPGPGAYVGEDVKRKAPNYAFSRTPRQWGKAAPIPGPGHYTIANTFAALPPYERAKIK